MKIGDIVIYNGGYGKLLAKIICSNRNLGGSSDLLVIEIIEDRPNTADKIVNGRLNGRPNDLLRPLSPLELLAYVAEN